MSSLIQCSQFADLPNGMRLHFASAGAPGRPMVLFVHGFPEAWFAWEAQLEAFGANFYAVAVDLRGFNLSAKPADLDAYRPKKIVEDLAMLIAHLGYRETRIVAHDWGGALTWNLAIFAPQCVRKLVIVNAPHPGVFARLLRDDPGQQKASQYMLLFCSPQAETILSRDNYAALVDAVLGSGLKSGVFNEDDRNAYIAAWSQAGALTGGLNYYRAARVGPPQPGAESTGNFAVDPTKLMVRVPTLVIWGEKDTALLTANLDGLEQFVPELTVRRIPEGTHWVTHEKPDEVNGYIHEFLEKP